MALPEVLAPVGGREQLEAAVRSGADAVYLGAKGFNARRNAENFDELGLPEAVAFCHGRGVRVYVTLNTLVTDPEIPALVEELRSIAAAGADAIIVQDLGVADMARKLCPGLPLHGSTQMAVHSLAGARMLEKLGFSRVVLARELDREEIAAICRGTSLEVEVFVHGALCMSVSGLCYLSSLLGERSGNRGLCAQPCRLDWKSKGRSYALSLKDLSLVDRLEELAAMGVASLKIEGRMKRPEYVGAAVSACRRALAGERPDLDTLQSVFSRSGFTAGYYENRRNLEMFGHRRKEDVAAAAGVLPGLAAAYRHELCRVPVEMTLTMERGNPARLTVRDGSRQVTEEGDTPQEALNRPTDAALARRSLEKTGGTPFILENLETFIQPGLMLPMSALNRLRAAALERLLALRSQTPGHPCGRVEELPQLACHEAPSRPLLRGRFESPDQLTPEALKYFDEIILKVEDILADPALAEKLGGKLLAEAPLLVFPRREEAFFQSLETLRERGITRLLAGNLATVLLGREAGLAVSGDWGLNVLNSRSLALCRELGLRDVTLSFETSLRLAASMADSLPRGVLGYGYLPLMTLRNCPGRGGSGCGNCPGSSTITDRRGNVFGIRCRGREYSHLLNMVPLWLGDKQEALRGLDHVTLRFTGENAAGCLRVARAWREGEALGGDVTRGLSFRELK